MPGSLPSVVCSRCRHDVPIHRGGAEVVAAEHSNPQGRCPGSLRTPLGIATTQDDILAQLRELGRLARAYGVDREIAVHRFREAFNEVPS